MNFRLDRSNNVNFERLGCDGSVKWKGDGDIDFDIFVVDAVIGASLSFKCDA